MTLREAIDAVMIEKDWDQTELGAHIGAPQSMVSRMRKGDDWELHWQVFLRMLRLLIALKIIGRADLYTTSDKVEKARTAKVADSEDFSKSLSKSKDIMLTLDANSLVLQ